MNDHSVSDETSFHRRIAARCNNAAWDLIERETLDAGDCVELVRLAATAAYHWKEIGTADNVASAELLLGWALAKAGAGSAAVDAASRAFKHFSEKESEAQQMAIPHAAMAIALHSASDPEGHRRHYIEARQLGMNLPAQDMKYFEAAFRTIPRPVD
jgi:hypothetical protein